MTPKSPAIDAARRIMRGDYAGARCILRGVYGLRPFEARAIAGAAGFVREHRGAPGWVSLAELAPED